MDLGRCPRCARPYSASEVLGFGVLRSRTAHAGGPWMEFECPDCACLIRLVPHGSGRYAPPGEPPPASVPEADRRPPWVVDGNRRQAATAAPPRGGPEPEADPAPDPEPEAAESPDPEPDVGEAPMGPVEALELLGCRPTAGTAEIEQAFRDRSLTCHPDKVAHLDRDFQVLAEEKFKRLRRALDILSS